MRLQCVKDTKKAKNWKKNMESSCLRKTDKESLANFSFDVLLKELEVRAPLFLLVLKAAAFNSKDVNEKWKASITVAAATCLRNRSRNMIACISVTCCHTKSSLRIHGK